MFEQILDKLKTKTPLEDIKLNKQLQSFADEYLESKGATSYDDLTYIQKSQLKKKILPKVPEFLKAKGKRISRNELAKILDEDPDFLRSIQKTAGGKPNVRYQLFQDTLGDTVKLYRPVSGANEAFYNRPTKQQIEEFKKIKRANTILPVSINRINELVSNKKFMNMLKTRDLADPSFLRDVKKLSPGLRSTTTQQLADAVMYIARASKGEEFLGINIPKNIPLSKKLMKQFEKSKWGNPFHAAAYKVALADMDIQLQNKSGSFRDFQKKLRERLGKLGIKDFKNYEVDEVIGTAIGGKQNVAPYSVFSRFVSDYYNAGPGAAFQGALSRESIALGKILQKDQKAINKFVSKLQRQAKTPASTLKAKGFGSDRIKFIKTNYPKFAKEIQKNPSKAASIFVNDFNKTVAGEYERKYKVATPQLSLNTPEKDFGKERLARLGTIGQQIKNTYAEKGYGYKLPKDVLTQKEILALDDKALTRYIRKTGTLAIPAYLGYEFLPSVMFPTEYEETAGIGAPIVEKAPSTAQKVAGATAATGATIGAAKTGLGKKALKVGGRFIAPVFVGMSMYDTGKALQQGKGVVQSLEEGILGTGVTSAINQYRALSPEGKEAFKTISQAKASEDVLYGDFARPVTQQELEKAQGIYNIERGKAQQKILQEQQQRAQKIKEQGLGAFEDIYGP